MTNEGTEQIDGEVQLNEDTSQEGSTDDGTQSESEVTLLKSRAAGLDAKVTEQTKALKAAKAAEAAALQKLADYEAGKVGSDEALRAQLQAKEAEATELRKEAQAARVEAKYPEAFKELGAEAAIILGDEKLASIEARLQGVAEDAEPPTPRGNNGTRDGNQTNEVRPMSSDDMLSDMKRRFPDPLSVW